ncbi:MAG TPA: hypothetical protein VIY68_07675 [Steroidobacteraceae bacterium]
MRKELMSRRENAETALIPAAPLLITESADDFADMSDALNEEIRPRGIIEQLYIADVAHLSWEILRIWRCKAIMINMEYKKAIKAILQRLAVRGSEIHNDAEDLSYRWFVDEDARKTVLDFLKEFQLDESAIEAEAIGQGAVDLDLLDRLLASLQSRRDRTLRCIGEYRGSLAKRLRASSDRIIDGKVTRLKDVARRKVAVKGSTDGQ